MGLADVDIVAKEVDSKIKENEDYGIVVDFVIDD